MAGSGFQPLSRGEVAEQLNALGYKNFSPEKIKQITEDLAAYLADEGLLTDTSDQSYLSASSAQYSPTNNSPRAPLQDVRESSHHHQQFVRFDHPDSYGKENFSERDFTDQKAFSDEVAVDDSSEQSYRQDEGHMSRPAAKSKPLIKRKVVRKRNGQAQIFDESITESESDISYLNDRLAELHLPLRGEKPQEEYAESEASTITQTYQAKRRPKSASSSRWSDGGSSQTSERYSNQPLKSFIRPSTAPVKWKHDRKTDPVTRHQMYAAHWKSKKAPGERNHKGLRWNIREQMLYRDDVVLPRQNPRVYVPNNYQVPTEKKRQALRWAVRNSLANREMPYSTFNF
ncbi:centriolar and ciliogenesis-associated protein HYLS1-like [Apostichopus japonicus]|uniref:centriolar and ciliogenesis-associated protein HYLS1-like n=1 Tax=Stichopus japonicus TaxID=307972 RepID=UPI003AB26D52